VQSTTRVEFLDRYSDGPCGDATFFESAYRPQEAANARIADAMLRRLREIAVSPVTGAPITAAISTGDNTDNQQANELTLHLGLMNGGPVTPQSGAPDRYEGVQVSGDPAYWHPEEGVDDRYTRTFGFPKVPGFLDAALELFTAVGAGIPWFTCYGNHDGLAQGNAPANPAFEAIAVGPAKVVGLPPGTDPCNELDDLGFLPVAPTQPTTADPERRYLARQEWIQAHLDSPGLPAGHGFNAANATENVAYYAADVGPVRWIVLDTVNPGGVADGSIGVTQLEWLEHQLAQAQEARKLVMLFSHHGLRSLTNPVDTPDPFHPQHSDSPRRRADDVLAVVGRFTCVVAWVSGHTHLNVVTPRRGTDIAADLPGAFWDIGTSAHIDWPSQARIVELVDNGDGTLSVFGTVFDHADDPIVVMARELGGNDPQKGFGYGDGEPEDRNVELLIAHPFPEAAAGGPPAEESVGVAPPPPPIQPTGPALPATGPPAGLTVGGALAVAGAIGVRRLRERAAAPPPPPA
jgi:metallophosphoesterase (TIGR03767 family)